MNSAAAKVAQLVEHAKGEEIKEEVKPVEVEVTENKGEEIKEAE